MQKCPYCAEEIQDEAVKCRYCGSRLGMTAEEEEAVEAFNKVLEPLTEDSGLMGSVPGWLVGVVVVAAIGLLWGLPVIKDATRRPSPSYNSSVQVQPTPRPTPIPPELRGTTKSTTVACLTTDWLEKSIVLAKNNDEKSMKNYLVTGKCIVLEEGTKVSVADHGPKITEFVYQGDTYYTYSRLVY